MRIHCSYKSQIFSYDFRLSTKNGHSRLDRSHTIHRSDRIDPRSIHVRPRIGRKPFYTFRCRKSKRHRIWIRRNAAIFEIRNALVSIFVLLDRFGCGARICYENIQIFKSSDDICIRNSKRRCSLCVIFAFSLRSSCTISFFFSETISSFFVCIWVSGLSTFTCRLFAFESFRKCWKSLHWLNVSLEKNVLKKKTAVLLFDMFEECFLTFETFIFACRMKIILCFDDSKLIIWIIKN